MQRITMTIVLALMVAGCGIDGSDKKPSGVKETRNYMQEGMDYLQKTDIANAMKSFNRAIKADPANAQNYLIVGQVYLKLNNYIRASDSFASAIKVDPTNGAAYFLLGQSQALRGQRAEAIETIKKSITIFKAQKDEARFNSALSLLRNLVEPSSQEEEEAQKAKDSDSK